MSDDNYLALIVQRLNETNELLGSIAYRLENMHACLSEDCDVTEIESDVRVIREHLTS